MQALAGDRLGWGPLQVMLRRASASMQTPKGAHARSVIGAACVPLTAALLYANLKMQRGQTTSSTSAWDKLSKTARTVILVALFYGGNRVIDKWLQGKFPSALVGMLGLFGVLSGLSATTPAVADEVLGFSGPGVTFLNQWLPLFFVTPLVTLPLSVSAIPSPAEALKFAAVIGGGFIFNLLTTAGAVLGLVSSSSKNATAAGASRAVSGTKKDDDLKNADDPVDVTPKRALPKPPPPPAPQFPSILTAATIASAAGIFLPVTDAPLLLALTGLFFIVGRQPPPSVTKVLHPLVTCGALTSVSAVLLGLVTEGSWNSVLKGYKTGSLKKPGAGDILLELLPLGLIGLAYSLHGQRFLLRDQAAPIMGGAFVGSSLSLLFSAVAAKVLSMSPVMATTPLPRSVMSALAIPIAKMVNADVSIAVTGVVLSGLLGANFAASLLSRAGVKDAVARGVATGNCSHGLGTAALVANEPLAASVSAVSLALTGAFTTVLMSIPAIRNALVSIALSSARAKKSIE